ncbi:multicopper oxidase family protein [Paludisphaera rhizosphaerae]|uniref:multicopper oxidase family protein n=1 Tax=Paludisphaera rhizosphaerae TaxID=2711216 RepID=UPI0013EB0410|nr:multicopper oxidase domain-containing protein [Paludisphaera rhizosphaerae]
MLNRRDLIRAAAAAAAGASASNAGAQDPPGPFDDPTVRFDKAKADEPPNWAFRTPLQIPPTPRPTAVAAREDLEGPSPKVPAFGPTDAFPIGDCFHGVAREWAMTPPFWKLYDCNPNEQDHVKAWYDKRDHFGKIIGHRHLVDKDGNPRQDVDNWGGFPVKCFKIPIQEARVPIDPLPFPTLFYTYAGMVPGPTLRMRIGQPTVVRFHNHLETETSIHFHGGHNPSHSDGFPTFYVLQGKSRDYFYPNIAPMIERDKEKPETEPKPGDAVLSSNSGGYIPDVAEAQSTCWYHDHGMDCTAYNVSKGLAGFVMVFSERELELIASGVLPGEREKSCQDPELYGLKTDPKEVADLEDPKRPGFYLRGKEPYHNPYDIPIVIQDKVIDYNTGQIAFDTNAHNGYLGDTFLLNGTPWPKLCVENRKYRFRFLNGSNARIYRLRFLSEADYDALRRGDDPAPAEAADAECAAAAAGGGDFESVAKPFLRIGKDSWLWPKARTATSLLLPMANRADLVVDFKELTKDLNLGKDDEAVFYLVNTMAQTDGRGPRVKLDDPGDPRVLPVPFDVAPGANPLVRPGKLAESNRPVALMKIIVRGAPLDEKEDASIKHGTCLNPHEPIKDEEVQVVRQFIFERGKGAWRINGRFYDPTIANATPSSNSVEEWVLRNGGGGWWHPIHIHLESHQLVSYQKDFAADDVVDLRDPPNIPRLGNLVDILEMMDAGDQIGLHDTQVLGPNTIARIRMRFRTWNGPFVFHCHNVDHEDMRMMFNFEPVDRDYADPIHGDLTAADRELDHRLRANVAPDSRTHGDDLTHQPDPDHLRVGEPPWEYPPVPGTPARDVDDLIHDRKRRDAETKAAAPKPESKG